MQVPGQRDKAIHPILLLRRLQAARGGDEAALFDVAHRRMCSGRRRLIANCPSAAVAHMGFIVAVHVPVALLRPLRPVAKRARA